MRTFKFHDNEGRRLALFGEVQGDHLEIFILACSEKDQFNKEVARSIYATYKTRGIKGCATLGYHPEIELINIAGKQDQARNIFSDYCWENYHNPYAHTILQLEVPNCRLVEVLDLLKENKLI